MSRKILRFISVVLSVMMIFASVYTIFSHFSRDIKIAEGLETKELAAEGEDMYNHMFDNKTEVTTTNANYQKPDITLDDVVKELAKYGHVGQWNQNGKGYNDVWEGTPVASKTKDSKYIEPNNVTMLDCGEFIYAGLRHLDVRFTGFYDGVSNGKDGRLGPIPITPNGYVRYEDSTNPERKPYHIKWENGSEIARITNYTQREVYDEASKTMKLVCGYGKWIDDNKIAPGTIVASPAASSDLSGHVWLYIGKFNSRADVVNYLKGLGIAVRGEDGNTTGIRVLDEAEEGDSKVHWSIECRGSSHGNGGGVTITNRDPAGQSGDKKGAGYIGFTFLEEKITNGAFSMDIKKVDRANGNALSGAKFHFEDRNTKPVTARDDIITDSNGIATLVGNQTIGSEKTYTYSIKEIEAPDKYVTDIDKHFGINVNTGLVGKEYQVKNVKIWGGGITEQTIEPGKSYRYLTNGTWEEGDSVSSKTLFHVKLDNSKTNMHLALIWANPEIKGKFKLSLVKSNKEGEKLGGAEFRVDVKDGTENIYSGTRTTSSNEASLGTATFSNIPIEDEGKTYSVTITETKEPAGYIGMDAPITFDVTTQKAGDEYKLVPVGDITSKVKNAKKVEVKEGEILIEAENRTTSVDIHKGVKTVENQDSGYFHTGIVTIPEDEGNKNEETAGEESEGSLNDKATDESSSEETAEEGIVDETTGKEYKNELELKDIYHEWVVETTIPEAANKYKKYLITDPVDLSKLDFSGIERVVVQRVDKDGKILETLTKDKDYQVEYNEDKENNKGNLVVTYINKKDGKNFHGAFLTEAGVKERAGIEETKIRVTFNTTFKVNENGKLAVLDGAVTNAENKSTLTYDNGSGKEEEKDSEQPEVHTGAVSIFKYEDTNGNGVHDEGEKALVGAEFKIALTEEDAKAGKFIKINGEELTAVTNEHGIATFVGLSFGGDAKDDEKNLKDGLYKYDWETASREYYIVETKTPGGYEKLEDAVKVVVSKNSSEIIDMTDKINEMESVGNRPLVFDLALRKWVTQAIVTENGKTVVYETGHKADDNPEDAVKVDLKKSKLKDVEVKFRYSIRITNEGEVAGEADEITDYIPEGLKFVKEDNPDWETTDNERVVKTDKLKGVTLEHGESAEVEITLTWINSASTMGVMINTAEISKDHNEYGIHDIDSTPNNKKKGEDDIDDAPVMLTIKTGSEIIPYIGIALGFITTIAGGVIMIKRSLLSIMQ